MKNFFKNIKNCIENKCYNGLNKNLKQDIINFAHTNFLTFFYNDNIEGVELKLIYNYNEPTKSNKEKLVLEFYKYMCNKYCKDKNIFYCDISIKNNENSVIFSFQLC
jgi:hypothetical protein